MHKLLNAFSVAGALHNCRADQGHRLGVIQREATCQSALRQQRSGDDAGKQVVPVLTPLTFDPSRPFPRILNKSLNFIVRLKGRDAYGRRRHRGMHRRVEGGIGASHGIQRQRADHIGGPEQPAPPPRPSPNT